MSGCIGNVEVESLGFQKEVLITAQKMLKDG